MRPPRRPYDTACHSRESGNDLVFFLSTVGTCKQQNGPPVSRSGRPLKVVRTLRRADGAFFAADALAEGVSAPEFKDAARFLAADGFEAPAYIGAVGISRQIAPWQARDHCLEEIRAKAAEIRV